MATLIRMARMETKYVVRFNAKTLKASIHAAACPVAANAPRGFVCMPVEGNTPAEAAEGFYVAEEFEARGIKRPAICKCAR